MTAHGSRSRGHVHSLKASLATPLGLVGLVDDDAHARLRAVSITTVEELLGVLIADPHAVARLLPGKSTRHLRARARDAVAAPLLDALDAATERRRPKGALPPEPLAAEARADAAYVDSWLDQAEIPGQADDEPLPGVSLIDEFGPVRDQGGHETCVAHAVCALLEHQQAHYTGAAPPLSAEFVHWRAKRNDGLPDKPGTRLRVALPQTAIHGACLERTWPDAAGPPPASARREARERLLIGPTEVPDRDSESVRELIDVGRPVAVTVPVYECWDANGTAHTFGLIPMPLPGSERRGGQALCIVGYGWDSEFAGGGYFIVRNSWGEQWAPLSPIGPGHGALPFLYLDRYAWELWTTDARWELESVLSRVRDEPFRDAQRAGPAHRP